MLRGLQPDKYSNLDNILLYLGVTSYIAERRGMQDFDGRMIRAYLNLCPLILVVLVLVGIRIPTDAASRS